MPPRGNSFWCMWYEISDHTHPQYNWDETQKTQKIQWFWGSTELNSGYPSSIIFRMHGEPVGATNAEFPNHMEVSVLSWGYYQIIQSSWSDHFTKIA